MSQKIEIELSDSLLEQLEPYRALLRDFILLGFHEFKLQEALRLYQLGEVSLGYAAETVGVSKRELVQYAKSRGIEPGWDEEILAEELA